jgi:hypothetical protein
VHVNVRRETREPREKPIHLVLDIAANLFFFNRVQHCVFGIARAEHPAIVHSVKILFDRQAADKTYIRQQRTFIAKMLLLVGDFIRENINRVPGDLFAANRANFLSARARHPNQKEGNQSDIRGPNHLTGTLPESKIRTNENRVPWRLFYESWRTENILETNLFTSVVKDLY